MTLPPGVLESQKLMGGEDTVLRNICTVIAPPGADLPFQAALYKALAVYPEVTGGGMLVFTILLVSGNRPELVLHGVR